ncbi:MAG: cupin domain-containing protein [Pseudomonadota bacterium]
MTPFHADTMPDEFYTEERCFIREWINTPDQPEASLAQCRVVVGTTTQKHRLSVTEWYLVRQGIGELRVAEQAPIIIKPGDRVCIPAGASQQVLSTGDEDLVFDCFCVPRFTPDCYESLE